MPYSVACPSCGTKAYLSRSYRGATTLCRGCGARFDVTASAGHELRNPAPEPITLVLNPDPERGAFNAGWGGPDEGGVPAVRRELKPQRHRDRHARRTLLPGLKSFGAVVLLGLGVAGIAVGVWLALGLLLAPVEVEPPGKNSPEYLVALSESPGELPPSDKAVYKFRFLIRKVSSTYQMDPAEVARTCLTVARKMKDAGLSADMTEILNGAIEAADNRGDIGLNVPSLIQYLDAYEQFRGQGQDHESAIATIARLKLL